VLYRAILSLPVMFFATYGARENGVFLILSFYIRFYMVFSAVFKHLYSILHRNFNTELAVVFWKSFKSTLATIRRSLV